MACDSTAVYQRFDIGTDKVPPTSSAASAPHGRRRRADRGLLGGALCARCRRVIREITARGRVPILVGGTGLYFRALTRGLSRDRHATGAARAAAAIAREGAGDCTGGWGGSIRRRRARIQPRDEKRLVRALEVALVTGSADRALRRRPRRGCRLRRARARPPAAGRRSSPSVWPARRAQFASGVVGEVRAILAERRAADGAPFTRLVYRR